MKRTFLASAALAAGAFAQDPAEGWLGYAAGTPPQGFFRLTYAEATWKNLQNPVTAPNDAFYSPWFGSDPSDNLNLIQPVNPWLGDGWEGYCEYFQWSPENNINSNSINTNPGDTIYGNMTFLGESRQAYRLCQSDLSSGQSACMDVPVQQNSDGSYKNFSIIYFVFEKPANCQDYPPDNVVTFENIKLQYDGTDVTSKMQWRTAYVDDYCDMRAHIVGPSTVSITWNSQATEAEKNPTKEVIEARRKVGLQRRQSSKGSA